MIIVIRIHDPNSVGSEWKRWLRSFQLYADGKGLIIEAGKDDNKGQRRALLLHCAGLDVQDIFDVLPETGNPKEYEKAEEALTRHFVTQVNVPYERHMFREMAQNENETIDQCRSSDLRRKFLEKGQTLNLKQLQEIARTSEAVKRQVKRMNVHNDGVNRVSEKPGRQDRHESKGEKGGKVTKSGQCFRCGKPGHFARDPRCPAKGKEVPSATRKVILLWYAKPKVKIMANQEILY
ncbi:Transposon Ty3-I Gag-Pol poly [Paramuricea clavata]|uniref:Transposon Ty3-I Gag-Pol poly, partial n=1 Tax=Paramuricea clavata TaxID=317549 RepID=A0A6S7I4E1_PARCT|nr:Transposon Ty3-I Gag-Pol poly [Paramuricea clavata]